MKSGNQVLSRVLILQDRVGVRQSGHFDHDSHAMTGPAGELRLHASPLKALEASTAQASGRIKFRFTYDSETGEPLSQ